MLQNPDFLILDEATSDLDSQSERLIQETIDNLKGERTMLIIAHWLSTIVNAYLILVLKKGHLVEQGSHEESIERDGVYSGFWKLRGTA